MKKPINILEKIYFWLLVLFFIFIVAIGHIIKGGINIGDIVVEEEYIESFFIIILFITGYTIFKFYKKEISKKEKRILEEKKHNQSNEIQLEDAFKYIGQVNVQIQEINDVFVKLKEFPEKKNDFNNIVNYLNEKILGITGADWVLLRILDLNSGQTLKENIQIRGNSVLLKYKISNQSLIKKEVIEGHGVIRSEQNNLGLKAYAIFPIKKINKEQIILIKAIINQLEMMFIIFHSKYYKK